MRAAPAIALMSVLFMTATAAAAAEKTEKAQQPRATALVRVVECRTLTEPEERLACYDREVAALDSAEANKQVMVVDKEQVRKTRRSLFGLQLPDLGIFGGNGETGDDDAEEVSRLEAKIKSASQSRYGQWSFELEDGARWTQTDDHQLGVEPKPGQMIVIKRAALGSYMASVNGQRSFRIQRIR